MVVMIACGVLAGLLMGLLLAAWLVVYQSRNKPAASDPATSLNGNP
jgi:hypothetical protein